METQPPTWRRTGVALSLRLPGGLSARVSAAEGGYAAWIGPVRLGPHPTEERACLAAVVELQRLVAEASDALAAMTAEMADQG
ncbi:MAG TPA: hypothetical protein VD838_01390 [Anaeromyxobacteraceae bacterium]|nr:hypothetical protein [Anaeromyxobacteraceae bacterium]